MVGHMVGGVVGGVGQQRVAMGLEVGEGGGLEV